MDITPNKQMIKPAHQGSAHGESLIHMLGGIHFKFPTFKHDHAPVMDVNAVADEQMTVGQRIADTVASTVGSWPFIITQSFFLLCWLILNSLAWINRWDPYPFILLNLALSFQAAYAAPFVMMSQNRQSAKDRLMAESDYHCNLKGEEEVRNIMEHLDHQDTVILQILQHMEAHHKEMMVYLSQLDPETARKLGMDIQQVSKEIVEEEQEDITGNS
jgi:uncharacterized membrane protein